MLGLVVWVLLNGLIFFIFLQGCCEGISSFMAKYPYQWMSEMHGRYWPGQTAWQEVLSECLKFLVVTRDMHKNLWKCPSTIDMINQLWSHEISLLFVRNVFMAILRDMCGHFYWHGSSLIPGWISNYMPSKVWDEITYQFQNFGNG